MCSLVVLALTPMRVHQQDYGDTVNYQADIHNPDIYQNSINLRGHIGGANGNLAVFFDNTYPKSRF
jgi:hypothetical protein